MCILSMCWNNPLVLQMKLITILVLLILVPVSAVTDEKFDQTAMVQPMPETSIKCGECPCVNPCSQQQQQPPPPPPPSPPPPMTTQSCPPPPPPRFYYFSGPEAQTQAGPPPPRFTYVIGSPGNSNVYPNDPFNLEIYNGGVPYQCNVLLGLLLLIICGLL